MPSTETTSLTGDKPARVYYARDALPFYSQRRKQRLQLRCVVYTIAVAIFTMALIVTVSYSVSHDMVDVVAPPNLTVQPSPSILNLTRPLKLGFAPGSGSYTLYSNNPSIVVPPSNSIVVSGKNAVATPSLSEDEIREGLEAGRRAINERLFADATALMSPLPSPSPESRHRYAVSTCPGVAALALAATAEIAATKQIESSRRSSSSLVSPPSAFGSFFDAGWKTLGVCKQLVTPYCPSGRTAKYRTFDGSCNRPKQLGASMTPFRRILPPSYADGVEQPRRALSGAELPSARQVSLKVHKPSPSSNPRFTVMLAVYGQFLDHDITATAISQGINGSAISCCPASLGHPECFPVPVSVGDPVFDVAGRTCMDFVRSAPAPQCKLGPRQQLNQVTAFIDGSAIYGSDASTSRGLREFAGGRLRMQSTPDNRTLLPASKNPNDGCNRETERLRGRYCFAAGDARANENLHLTTMHLLWARQHNRIVEQLARLNPAWNDETLYQEARRIVGAQLQHITYQEFVPIVLGERETDARDLRPLRFGYRSRSDDADDPSNDPSIANSFAAAAFRFAHTLLPGLMKMTDEQRGTSSYVELHRMLFNPYSLYAEGGVKRSVTSATRNTIQMTSTHVTSQLTNHLFEDPLGNVTVPCGLDLVSLNIQRGRDHGLPGYTRWREHCGLGRAETFQDLAGHLDPQALQEISRLYESVHDVDLYTGALAEFPVTGGIVGPTFSCLLADQFVRLQRGDRFWYEAAGQPHSFTEDQLAELRKTSLARLVCDCSDGVTQTQPEVMRAIGPDNTMMSCDDIPAPSFEPWREEISPILRASFMPVNWTAFKTDINDTIRDVLSYISNSKASATLDTDMLAFKDYINNTFSELRNRLSELHPPKAAGAAASKEKFSMDPEDSFVLKSTGPADVYQDWIAFRNQLRKSLNDSVETLSSDPDQVAKWLAFKKNIIDQFADLKDRLASMRSYVVSKLKTTKNQQERVSMNGNESAGRNIQAAMIPAIFDWKNFKDDILSSLDATIMTMDTKIPPPGDPAWAIFGDDIGNGFSTVRDKMDGQRSGTGAMESATGKWPQLSDDWLAYKTEIIETVNDAVNRIKDGMPPPGDPAWSTYRDQVIKSFSAFGSTPSPVRLATYPILSKDPARPAASSANKWNSPEWFDLTNDWFEFRARINDSLAKIIRDVESKKPIARVPAAWSAFKDSTVNEFARLKDEIAVVKAEWLGELAKLNANEMSTNYPAGSSPKKAPAGFARSRFMVPAIPPEEWIDFKRGINDTLMNIFAAANSTGTLDLDELHRSFNESFAAVRDEISSLAAMIADTCSNETAQADWLGFQMRLNATVQELVHATKNDETRQLATGDLTRILFHARQRVMDLQPPQNFAYVSHAEWIRYVRGVNKTITEALNKIGARETRSALKLAADGSVSSSSSLGNSKKFHWLLVPCLATSLRAFTMISRFQVAA